MLAEADAVALVDEVNAATGADLVLRGIAAQGGTGGAVFVQWPDGRQGVVTPSVAPLAALQQQADLMILARSRGIAVPEYQLVVPLAERRVIVQERVPGEVKRLDVAKLETMIEVNEQFADLLADRPDVPVPMLLLRHERGCGPLETHSARSRRLLDCVREVGEVEMHGTDLVHADLNHTNVLFDDDGTLTGVIDWDLSTARGDRHFGLVKMRYILQWEAPDPVVLARLDEILEDLIEPDTLRAYWAHWGLRLVDWSISHFGPREIDLHLELAESRLLARRG